jgi:hypothetical protein
MLKPRLAWLLVFVPVAVVLELTHADPVIIFGVSALAILPLAGRSVTPRRKWQRAPAPRSEGC